MALSNVSGTSLNINPTVKPMRVRLKVQWVTVPAAATLKNVPSGCGNLKNTLHKVFTGKFTSVITPTPPELMSNVRISSGGLPCKAMRARTLKGFRSLRRRSESDGLGNGETSSSSGTSG